MTEGIEAVFFDMGGTLRTRVADEGLRHQALEHRAIGGCWPAACRPAFRRRFMPR